MRVFAPDKDTVTAKDAKKALYIKRRQKMQKQKKTFEEKRQIHLSLITT